MNRHAPPAPVSASPSRAAAVARLALALAVLLSAGGYLRYAKAQGKMRILKLPAPLVRELSTLRRDCLQPYVVREVTRLPEETEHELGTRSYIQWLLEDPTAPQTSWRRTCSLFLTYYTGNPDQVPHVPEECYVQGAFSEEADEYLDFTLPHDGRTYRVRRLVFAPPAGRGARVAVYYTFCVNGDFYAHRTPVRLRMARADEKYLYYSKLELSFRHPFKKENLDLMDRTAEQLFGRLIPILVKEHLPDLAALERGEAAAAGREN